VDIATMEAAEDFLSAYRFARDRIGAPVIDIHSQEGALNTEGWRADDD